jgi:putative glutamine amidotransferase
MSRIGNSSGISMPRRSANSSAPAEPSSSLPIIGYTMAYGEEKAFLENPATLVAENGGALIVLSHAVDDRTVDAYAHLIDGLVVGGGVEDISPTWMDQVASPHIGAINLQRDEFELKMTRVALRRQIPFLGICRGAHILNVALGGTLFQDLPSEYDSALDHLGNWRGDEHEDKESNVHEIGVVRGTALSQILSDDRLLVNSYHHQAIRNLGDGLIIAAQSPDGVVEAIERPGPSFCIGVQWHPELSCRDPKQKRLFAALVDQARARKRH